MSALRVSQDLFSLYWLWREFKLTYRLGGGVGGMNLSVWGRSVANVCPSTNHNGPWGRWWWYLSKNIQKGPRNIPGLPEREHARPLMCFELRRCIFPSMQIQTELKSPATKLRQAATANSGALQSWCSATITKKKGFWEKKKKKKVRRQQETPGQVLCHLHYATRSGMVIYGKTERGQANRTLADVSYQSPSLHTETHPANV